jgi:hypothetical protein
VYNVQIMYTFFSVKSLRDPLQSVEMLNCWQEKLLAFNIEILYPGEASLPALWRAEIRRSDCHRYRLGQPQGERTSARQASGEPAGSNCRTGPPVALLLPYRAACCAALALPGRLLRFSCPTGPPVALLLPYWPACCASI